VSGEEVLKKQSQFAKTENGIISYVKGTYGNIPTRRAEENKANQTQSKFTLSPFGYTQAKFRRTGQFLPALVTDVGWKN